MTLSWAPHPAKHSFDLKRICHSSAFLVWIPPDLSLKELQCCLCKDGAEQAKKKIWKSPRENKATGKYWNDIASKGGKKRKCFMISSWKAFNILFLCLQCFHFAFDVSPFPASFVVGKEFEPHPPGAAADPSAQTPIRLKNDALDWFRSCFVSSFPTFERLPNPPRPPDHDGWSF